MDGYDLQQAVRPFVRFIEDLTNWYIRRSRRRFWKSQDDDDKAAAYETLYVVLLELAKIAAPFLPFVSEAIFRNLRTAALPESVHLCDFPKGDSARRDAALEQQMDAVMRVVGLGRGLRSAHDLKVRQPLGKLVVVARQTALRESIAALQDLILDELNVKTAEFLDHESGFATVKAKADFSRLGPRLGPRVKKAAAAIAALPAEMVELLAGGAGVTVQVDGEPLAIEPSDVLIEHIPHAGRVVAAEGGIVVALETELTPELIQEGLAREFVNKVQNMRKTADFEVTQRIRIRLHSDEAVVRAVARHRDTILGETLGVECVAVDEKPADATEWDVNGHPCAVRVELV
jgi:isoleucyl-tRNA synthetase